MSDQYADFERDGEKTVRDNLAQGNYKDRRAALAHAWLENLERNRGRAFADKQIGVARHSRNAAFISTGVAIFAALATFYFNRANLVASNRAWIEPARPEIVTGLKAGEPLKFVLAYTNIGKQPALGVVINAIPRTVEPPKDGNWYKPFPGRNETCEAAHPNENGLVVYPSADARQATTYFSQRFPEQAKVLDGTQALVIEGCIGYETFNEAHYSAFCYYVQPFVEKATTGRAIMLCPTHNHAT